MLAQVRRTLFGLDPTAAVLIGCAILVVIVLAVWAIWRSQDPQGWDD